MSETQAAFTVASELAAGIEDVSERFPAYYGLWSASFARGDLKPMQEMGAACLRDVESRPKSPEASIAQRISGMTRWFEGNFIEAQRHLEQALAVYDAVRDRELAFRFGQDLGSAAMGYLGQTLLPLGALDRANSLTQGALTHALGTRHIPTIVYAHASAGFFEMMRHDRGRAAPHVQAILDVAREHGLRLWIAFGTFCEGWLRWGGPDRDAGSAEMHEGLALIHSQQVDTYIPLFMALLAETEAEAGSPDAALTIVDTQLATVERTGQNWYTAELYRVRGEILLKCPSSDAAAAEAAFARAINVAQSQSAKCSSFKPP